MGYFVKCWEIVKEDVMATFQNFHLHEIIEKSFNATYIALIPKKKGAKEFERFQTNQFGRKCLQADIQNSHRKTKESDA